MAGNVVRGPLVVTAPTKRSLNQPDLFPNIAVALGVIAAASLHPLLEPTFYKRPAQQIDIAPNIAVRTIAVPPALVIQQQFEMPAKVGRAPQIDLYPNIAVQFPFVPPPVSAITRGPLYVNTNFKQWAAPDVLPNVAVQVLPLAGVLSHSPEPTFFKRLPPQIDVIYNVALALVPAIANITTTDNLPPKIWPQVEVFPNVAVNFAVIVYNPPPPIDPWISKRYPPQIDVLPNVALKGVEPPRQFPALEWVLPARKWPTPDVLPNVALFNFPPLLFQQPDPTLTKRLWATFDIYPNVALYAPVEKAPLIEPIDPWTNKRYPPPVEVFQNKAIYVPAAPIPAPMELVDPALFKRAWLPPDVFPNATIIFSTQPVLTPVPMFIWLNGEPVAPGDGIKYLYWHPTANEMLLMPASGLSVISPIAVGASPFTWTAPQNLLVLLGAGQLASVVYDGIYPPNAPAGFVTPPTPGTGFVLNYDAGNDLAIPVNQGAILTITYTKIPLMYTVR